MAASPMWLPLLVLGLLVGLPGSMGSNGAESVPDSRNGGGIGGRRLREGRAPANETASSSMTERLARTPTTAGLGQIWVVGSYLGHAMIRPLYRWIKRLCWPSPVDPE